MPAVKFGYRQIERQISHKIWMTLTPPWRSVMPNREIFPVSTNPSGGGGALMAALPRIGKCSDVESTWVTTDDCGTTLDWWVETSDAGVEGLSRIWGCWTVTP